MNLHLTEIRLDYEAAVKAGLRDNYAWHQKIWLCFPDLHDQPSNRGRYKKGTKHEDQRLIDAENPPPFLTRLDPQDGHLRLLMLSALPPQRPPWCPTDAWRSKEVPEVFLTSASFRFSLVANPTQKLVVRDEAGNKKKNGRRVSIVHRDDTPDKKTGKLQAGLLSWLARKGETHGFTFDPDEVRTIPRSRQYFIKGGSVGLHNGVEFQGSLRVVDPSKFRHAFAQGIGSAKAFGFGMLVLAPLASQ